MRYVELIYAWIIVLISSKKRLLEISWNFNSWRWPFKCFGKSYKSMPDSSRSGLVITKYKFFRGVVDYARSRNTEYDALRYHQVTRGYNGMNGFVKISQTEFDKWYTEYKQH